jgi:serine protease Do
MNSTSGKTGIFILLLLVGFIIGAIAGGEIIRYLYIGPAQTAQIGTQRETAAPGAPAALPPAHPTHAADDIFTSRTNAIVRASREVAPCVVGIIVTQVQMVMSSPYYITDFFDLFFFPESRPRLRQVENMGSGFVIRDDGMILTNHHVVEGAQKLYVNYPDGRQFEGEIVGVDPQTDIAVIKIEAEKITSVRVGNSDNLMAGEWAIAIGNPFLNFIGDAHPTVTVGVISALNRNFKPAEGVYYQRMIQTDAAINPGNSGGPLINARGDVIGMNTFIYTGSKSSRGSIGIGFAIPINRAQRVVEELVRYGRRRQVYTGIAVQDLTRAVSLALGYNRTDGVVVADVQAGSPGATAGLKSGDIIIQLGDRKIESAMDIDGFFLDYFVGDTIPVQYIRGGKEKRGKIVLKEYPKNNR